MPDFRTHASIGERNDLLWFRRGNGARRWHGWLSLAAMVLAGLLLLVWGWWGDERVYWSAPVSSAHAMFQHDCAQCHVQSGAPLVRLATLRDAHPSVRDQDCQACHTQTSHDHSPRMQTEKVANCVQCHREHLDRGRLADVADQHCTQCHSDLKVTEGTHAFAASIPSFRQHPDFLLWQTPSSAAELQQRGSIDDWPVVATETGWRDRTELRFNHAKHLVDVGVLTAPPAEGHAGAHADRRQLTCTDCHQPDSAGQYMRPIRYEQHCAECHKLEFSGRVAMGGPLPHEAPDIVLGLLRDRLMKYAEAHPEVVESLADEARLPHKPATPTAQDRWTWVEQQMEEVPSRLFVNVEHGCAYCHLLQPEGTRFAITPPRIPERWLPSSRFDHARHRELSCVTCHDPQFDQRDEAGHSLFGRRTQLASQESHDILMPNIETCQACHGDRPATSKAPGARAHCVDCHDYHAPHRASAGKLDHWLRPRK